MTWVRLDDQWIHHPKFYNVGDHGQLCWLKGLTHASGLLTDGFIHDRATSSFLRSRRQLKSAIAELVAAGLWIPVEHGYRIHDFQDYQPLKAQVKAEREATNERVKRWRERQSNGVTLAVTNPVTNGLVNGLRGGARVGPGSDPDPEGVQGGTVVAVESGYDLAWRVWSDLWRGKYRTTYQRTIDQGPKGDDRVLQRIGELARACADPEPTLRHKLRRFFEDPGPWLVQNRHPLRAFEADWNKYGEPSTPPPSTPPAAPIVEAAPMSPEQIAAARKRLDEKNAQRAAARGGREQIAADLDRKLREIKS